jgi:glucose-6-phosphate 1-dehydrogenase
MEPPADLPPTDPQAARESVLACFRPLEPTRDVALGQFEGYRALGSVADDSPTDTFVAGCSWVDADRRREVPFRLRTGTRTGEQNPCSSRSFRRRQKTELNEMASVDGRASWRGGG